MLYYTIVGGGVSCVAFSENGYYLGSGAEEGGARIWDLRKLKCTKTLECTYVMYCTTLCVLYFLFPLYICYLPIYPFSHTYLPYNFVD